MVWILLWQFGNHTTWKWQQCMEVAIKRRSHLTRSYPHLDKLNSCIVYQGGVVGLITPPAYTRNFPLLSVAFPFPVLNRPVGKGGYIYFVLNFKIAARKYRSTLGKGKKQNHRDISETRVGIVQRT